MPPLAWRRSILTRPAMARPTISDVARHAGLSVATVDRVLNARCTVKPQTAARVLASAEAIGFHATGLLRRRVAEYAKSRTFGFVLQKKENPFYAQLGKALMAETRKIRHFRADAALVYVQEFSPEHLVAHMQELSGRIDAMAIVAIDHPLIRAQAQHMISDGIPVVALLSDIDPQSRTAYVGLDYRRAGRTAAWIMARLARKTGAVAAIVGSYRYLSQETNVASFQEFFREQQLGFRVLEPRVSVEDSEVAYEVTLSILKSNHDLVGLYIIGGGKNGVIRALRESKRASDIVVVCTNIDEETRVALDEGVIDLVLLAPIEQLAQTVVARLVNAVEADPRDSPSTVELAYALQCPESL